MLGKRNENVSSKLPNLLAFALCFSVIIFVLNLYDILGAQASVSSVVTISAVVPDSSGGGGPGGGSGGSSGGHRGGGGRIIPIPISNNIIFKGFSSPGSVVILLKDTEIVAEITASMDGSFQISLSDISSGVANFSILARDTSGGVSVLQTYTVEILSGATITVDGILILPKTINAYKTVPTTEQASSTIASLKIKEDQDSLAAKSSDLNGDKSVNILDFKILENWYRKSNPPKNIDLNHDGKIDLADFSILAYYWTG